MQRHVAYAGKSLVAVVSWPGQTPMHVLSPPQMPMHMSTLLQPPGPVAAAQAP
jgi:hypothetical protein